MSLTEIELPSDTLLHLVVVDNDEQEGSREIVHKLQDRLPFAVRYVVETRRGIPFARNKAIDISHELKADYIVFIDDDERVDPDWAVTLIDYSREKGGRAVIHGGVKSVFPEETPAYIRSLFSENNHVTGDQLNTCATNNVLFPTELTKTLGLRFDESRPLSGGTDTKFFSQAVAQGVVIYECREAVVYESISANRTNLKWLAKRKYRAGITESWRRKLKGRSPLSIGLVSLVRVTIESATSLFLLAIGNKLKGYRYYLKACRSAGTLVGVFGRNVDSYRVVDS